MPYIAPTYYDSSHNRPLKFELHLAKPFEKMVHSIAKTATASKRKDTIRNTEIALSVILGNLLRAHYRDPNRFVSVPLRNKDYPAGPFNPHCLGIRAVRRAVAHLKDAKPAYVETMGGNHSPKSKAGYSTRLRATKRLIDELEAPLSPEDGGLSLVAQPQSISHDRLYCVGELPILRLKPGKKDGDPRDFLPLPDSPCVAQMDAKLGKYNNFLEDHWVDLLIPDAEFLALQDRSKGDRDKYFGDPGRPIDLDLFLKRSLHRV